MVLLVVVVVVVLVVVVVVAATGAGVIGAAGHCSFPHSAKANLWVVDKTRILTYQ